MATGLPTDDKQQQDTLHNPGELAAAERFPSSHASAGIDQAEAYANDPANRSDPNENINQVQALENNPETNNLYRPTGGRTKSTITSKFQGLLKRKKTIAAIIAALGGGGLLVGGGMWFAFNTALLQIDASITKKVDTMSAAIETRYGMVMPTKLFGTSVGCSLPIECRYTGITKTQLDRMRVNGADLVNEDGSAVKKNPVTGRYTGDKLTLKTGEEITAKTYRSSLGKSTELRSLTRIIMKPTWASFNDKTAKAVRANRRLVTNPDWGKTDDPKEARTTVLKAVNGESSTSEKVSATNNIDEKSAGQKAVDTSSAADDINELIEADRAAAANGNTTPLSNDVVTVAQQDPVEGKLSASKILSGTLEAINPLGVVQGMCTTYQLTNLTVLTARTVALINDMRYASLFLSTAGKIKAGDATPEDVNKSMSILMTPDSNGRTFGDAFSYQYANYNKVTDIPQAASARGNDIISIMSTALATTQQFVGGGDAKTGRDLINGGCALATFGALLAFIPGAGLVANVGGKLFTEGAEKLTAKAAVDTLKTAINDSVKGAITKVVDKEARQQAMKDARSKILSLAKQPGTSIFLASFLAERYGVPYIAQQIAGTGLINADGPTAMDTIYTGLDAQNAETAKNRGMVPLTREQAINYQSFNVTYNDQYIADMQSESQPFDITNPYSPISTMAATFMPTLIKLSSLTNNIGNITSLPATLFSNAKSSLLGSMVTHAQSQSDIAAQYDYCPASSLGGSVPEDIALTPSCVPVMGLPDITMLQSAQSISLAKEMYDKGQIDENGTPQKEYKDLTDKCLASSGESILSEITVQDCFDTSKNNSPDNKLFQLYTLDQTLLDSIDTSPTEGTN